MQACMSHIGGIAWRVGRCVCS